MQQFTIGSNGTIDSVTKSGSCVDIWAGGGLPGGPAVQLYQCHGVANEVFKFDSGRLSAEGKLCLAGRDAKPSGGGGAGDIELWAKPVGGGRVAAFVVNNDGDAVTADVALADLNITSSAKVRDVWAHADLADAKSSISVQLKGHDSAMLVLTPN